MNLSLSTSATAPAPVILFLPAMGVPATFYAPFAGRLRDHGAELVTLDLPGQGESLLRARRGDDYGYREIVEQLVPDALQRLATRHPGRRLFLGGHSLGGQMAVLASADLPTRVDGLVLVAAGTAHWRAWPAGARLRAACTVHAISLAARLLPWYPGRWLGFGGEQSRRFMRDWSRNACTGIYAPEASLRSARDLKQQLAAVRLPVLSASIEGDPIAPAGAVHALCRLIPAAHIQVTSVPGVRDDSPWRRHFSWARRPGGVEEAILRWLGLGQTGCGVRDQAGGDHPRAGRRCEAAADRTVRKMP